MKLSERQLEAVRHIDGPLLILAGAGSGKTRVLTERTAYMISECGVNPYNILAITFTNKAADEMRERIDASVGFGSEAIWISTFHSMCVRILRRYIDRIGYDGNFTIYDTDDAKQVIKSAMKKLNLDPKMFKEKMFMGAISSAKDKLITPEGMAKDAGGDFAMQRCAEVYREYQQTLKKNNALDFDDLIVKTVELFKSDEEALQNYGNRFKYIMVDEYQDTNAAQFELVRLLASVHRNLCVVGDDDQSIYRFRGADIKNILSFETVYPDAKVVKLEQNYRSVPGILNAANAVIRNNKGRKEKTLWSDRENTGDLQFKDFDNANEEADFVATDIMRRMKSKSKSFKDFAVLYRTNAQSRLVEERFVSRGIPYKLVGGVNFYSRKEIKDILAYLKTIANGRDDLAVSRIVNVPPRKIGQTTVTRVSEYAAENGMSLWDALVDVNNIGAVARSASAIERFTTLIASLRAKVGLISLKEVFEELIEATGYVRLLEEERTPEAKARIENIDELLNKLVDYEENAENPSLDEFLEEVSLVADIDTVDENADCVLLMTLHGSKGLEFDTVYLTGLEDGLFPSFMSITADTPIELEEERRLMYVGITRAKNNLIMSAAHSRMIHGETRFSKISRFVEEIPDELIVGEVPKVKAMEIPRGEGLKKAKQSFAKKPFSFGGAGAYGTSAAGERTASARRPSESATARSTAPVQSEGELGYGVGDRVKHKKFGEGSVENIASGGRDFEITVNFDDFGTKKMFAGFAKLEKV